MNISSQIAKLREKAEQKTFQLMEISDNIAKSKEQIKVLKKDIAYLNEQISAFEMKQLSETLTSNGITKADIEAAIAAGHFKKPEPTEPAENVPAENAPDTPATESSTNTPEVNANETGSR